MGFFDLFKEKKVDSEYLSGFSKTNKSFGAKLKSLSKMFKNVDDDFMEELMEILLESDIGYQTATKIMDNLQWRINKDRLSTFNEVVDGLVLEMSNLYKLKPIERVKFNNQGLTVFLMVGVNGSGKTTTTGKLAYKYGLEGKKVVLGACDTFRAAAVSQLKTWGDKHAIPVVCGKEKEDSASVAVETINYALEDNFDIVILDTAGRLQNKVNLMNELAKIRRVVSNKAQGCVINTLLVIDATTGQNGISQAETFYQNSEVDGIVLSKMDGSAKGGIVIAIKDLIGIDVKYVGLGEKATDLKEFDLDEFLLAICDGLQDE
ncbi:MAG: signal recognition particle-docking protein FtsY [Erysipelotrichaceae bacterium]